MPISQPQHDQSAKYQIEPVKLPYKAQIALFESALRACALRGLNRIALYPAGCHSERLDLSIFETTGVDLCAVLDDKKSGVMHGFTITSPESQPQGVDAILISSDFYEHECAQRAQQWGLPVICPYQVLEAPRQQPKDILLERLRSTFAGKLNLGCGLNPIEGWTNIDGGDNSWYCPPDHEDVIPLDVFDAMAHLPDGSCDCISSEHFYEHFTLDDGYRMAQEWSRLLRPGGVVRVVTPDLEKEAKIYLGDLIPAPAEVYDRHKRRWLTSRHTKETKRFLTPAMLFNFGMRLDGHQFIYDFSTLEKQLEAVGLINITRCQFGYSEHPDLRNIDFHDGAQTGGDWIKAIQLVVEATKP